VCRVTRLLANEGRQQTGRQIAPADHSGASQTVRGFIKLYAERVFDPEAISLLAHAFEDAWHRVESSKAPYSTEEYAPAARIRGGSSRWGLIPSGGSLY
jgi:hypothetical protein